MQKLHGRFKEYLAGKRKTFNLPLAPKGTAFQMKVWAALQTIPYGETATYKDIAVKVASPLAAGLSAWQITKTLSELLFPATELSAATANLSAMLEDWMSKPN